MRTGELLAAGFWLAIALGITWSGWGLGLGTLTRSWLRRHDLLGRRGDDGAVAGNAGRGRAAAGGLESRQPVARHALVAHSLRGDPAGALCLALPALGFLTTTVLLLLVLFATIDRQSWIAPPVGAILITLVAYIVFHRLLGTQLPAGDAERWLGEHLPFIFGRA